MKLKYVEYRKKEIRDFKPSWVNRKIIYINWIRIKWNSLYLSIILQIGILFQILEYLHQTYSGSRLNLVDSLLGETGKWNACCEGKKIEHSSKVIYSKELLDLCIVSSTGTWIMFE